MSYEGPSQRHVWSKDVAQEVEDAALQLRPLIGEVIVKALVKANIVGLSGLEPLTSALSGRFSAVCAVFRHPPPNYRNIG